MKLSLNIGFGTFMGTGFSLLPIISSENGVKTAILASIGALVSFVLTTVLHLLKTLIKGWKFTPNLKHKPRT